MEDMFGDACLMRQPCKKGYISAGLVEICPNVHCIYYCFSAPHPNEIAGSAGIDREMVSLSKVLAPDTGLPKQHQTRLK